MDFCNFIEHTVSCRSNIDQDSILDLCDGTLSEIKGSIEKRISLLNNHDKNVYIGELSRQTSSLFNSYNDISIPRSSYSSICADVKNTKTENVKRTSNGEIEW